jgi:hypothetical protein
MNLIARLDHRHSLSSQKEERKRRKMCVFKRKGISKQMPHDDEIERKEKSIRNKNIVVGNDYAKQNSVVNIVDMIFM